MTLTWPAVSGATSYALYWALAPGVTPSSGTKIDGVSSPYVHGGLTNGQAHYYVVTAKNAGGQSPASPQASATPQSSGPSPYDPPWSTAAPAQVLTLTYDGGKTPQQNGAALKQAVQSLSAGQRLEIGGGTYFVDSYFSIDLQGTAVNPIWVVAQSGAAVVITRSDAAQNVVNVGAGGPSRFLCLRGLEITGGSMGMRLHACDDVWIDRCRVHDVAEAGITANTADTDSIHLTRNEIHSTGGTAEGMYLGANSSQWIMSRSVIALNHVYDTQGTQGDGIELKQGSWGNWIVENLVHDCNYPCILVYGTDGNAPNVIERNVCYRSNDNVMQVQGEAIVQNNLIVDGATGFESHDHQAQSRDLVFIHNTVVNTGRAANMASWNNRPGMVFANNVCYSATAEAIRFGNGSNGVVVTGNVTVGSVQGVSSGFAAGVGLLDFVDLSWNASALDAHPSAAGAIIASGDPAWGVNEDLSGLARVPPLESGCYDAP